MWRSTAPLRITVPMVGTENADILGGSQQDAGVPREAAYHQFQSRGSPFISSQGMCLGLIASSSHMLRAKCWLIVCLRTASSPLPGRRPAHQPPAAAAPGLSQPSGHCQPDRRSNSEGRMAQRV